MTSHTALSSQHNKTTIKDLNEFNKTKQNECNKIKIGIWNVRTLTGEERIINFTADLLNNNIQIAAINEHRIIQAENNEAIKDELLELELPNKYYLLFHNAVKNKQNAAVGGIGIVLNKEFYNLWMKTGRHHRKISDRIFLIKIETIQKIKYMFVCVYTPWNNIEIAEHRNNDQTTEEAQRERETFWMD